MNGGSGTERARTTLAFLRRKISSGEWPVNSKIPIEPELAEELEVGKSTIREAVRSLANLGMLETLPGRGTFVRSRTPVTSVLIEYIEDYDVEELQSVRRALEIEAAQMAAVHRTDEQLAALQEALTKDLEDDADYPRDYEHGYPPRQFHFLIFEATGSRLLPGLYAGVMTALRKAIDRGHVVYGATAHTRHADHEAILKAIENRDIVGVVHAMALHVDRDLIGDGSGPTQRADEFTSRGMGPVER